MGTSTERSSKLVQRWLIPILLSALGIVVIVQGANQSSSSAVAGGGNQDCPGGTTLIVKFDANASNYNIETASGLGTVTLSNETPAGADWVSTIPVAAIVVKGGPNSVVDWLNPPATSGSFSNKALPLVGSGQLPDISNVKFCSKTTTTSTTEPPATTNPTSTTQPPTTSTTTVQSTTVPVPTTGSGTGGQQGGATTSPPPTTAAGTAKGKLAFTGGQSPFLMTLGSLLVLSGLGLALLMRRRGQRD